MTHRKTSVSVLGWIDKFMIALTAVSTYYEDEFTQIEECRSVSCKPTITTCGTITSQHEWTCLASFHLRSNFLNLISFVSGGSREDGGCPIRVNEQLAMFANKFNFDLGPSGAISKTESLFKDISELALRYQVLIWQVNLVYRAGRESFQMWVLLFGSSWTV